MELGLSLAQLARRIGSSPAAVHRYESGWHRFEVHTLQKLAAAMGCRLRFELEQVARHSRALPLDVVVDQLRRLFWDKDLESADLVERPGWVIGRVLEMGALRDVHALIGLIGKERFLEQVARLRLPSVKVEACWRAMLEHEGFKCTRELSPRAARISWQR